MAVVRGVGQDGVMEPVGGQLLSPPRWGNKNPEDVVSRPGRELRRREDRMVAGEQGWSRGEGRGNKQGTEGPITV